MSLLTDKQMVSIAVEKKIFLGFKFNTAIRRMYKLDIQIARKGETTKTFTFWQLQTHKNLHFRLWQRTAIIKSSDKHGPIIFKCQTNEITLEKLRLSSFNRQFLFKKRHSIPPTETSSVMRIDELFSTLINAVINPTLTTHTLGL